MKEEVVAVGRGFIRSALHLKKTHCITLQYSALQSHYPAFIVYVVYLKTYIGMFMSKWPR